MTILRRILGVFIMFAGIIGLMLSLAGLVGLWMAKPALTTSMNATITTLISSVDVSQRTLIVTDEALGATVTSVEALSDILSTTATTVEDTQPVIAEFTNLMGNMLPATLGAAGDSLEAAEAAAQSLEGAIRSFESFRAILQGAPLLSTLIPAPAQTYSPEKPLADSLGELSVSIREMPATFETMSVNVDKADDNLSLITNNLDTMSQSVALISTSLSQYQAMIGESQTSMDNLKSVITDFQSNLERTLSIATLVIGLFLAWLLAAQIVIFSQGWELYHGTANQIAKKTPKSVSNEPASAD